MPGAQEELAMQMELAKSIPDDDYENLQSRDRPEKPASLAALGAALPRKIDDESVMGRESAIAVLSALVRTLFMANIDRMTDPLSQAAARRELEAYICALDDVLPWIHEAAGFPVRNGGVVRLRDLRAWAKRTPGMPPKLAEIVFSMVGDDAEITPESIRDNIDAIALQCKQANGGELTLEMLRSHLVKRFGISQRQFRAIIGDSGGVRRIYQRIGHQEQKHRPSGLTYGKRQK